MDSPFSPPGNVPNLRFPEFDGEWESSELGVIAVLSKGSGISKEQKSEKGNPCILYGELYTTYTTEIIDEVVSRTDLDPDDLVKSKANDIIIPASGETAIDISTARCVLNDDVMLGGDLNIIRLKEQDGCFFSYQLNGVRKKDIAKVAQGVSIVHLHGDSISHIKVNYPSKQEQKKIASLLSLIDKRIVIQSKVIEDLKKLKAALCELLYDEDEPNYLIGEVIEQISFRNRKSDSLIVLSVNNQLGFIEQTEQFENHTVASQDTSNYKIVSLDDFAYNPARINVGSIARLKIAPKGIVSPMYICFRCKQGTLPDYLESFFDTDYFYLEMEKRLEGSVRMCLSFEGLCNIPIYIPDLQEQKRIGRKIQLLKDKINLEESVYKQLSIQKHILLSQLFI